MYKKVLPGIIHEISTDIKDAILTDDNLVKKWNLLTPIMRNEWICWVEYPKQESTRLKHIIRLKGDILKGKKRPCCWQGCPHHNPNNKKYFT
ncbi:YdeI/OmpD-associated family protein [Candidatus Gracilibacteria bacterium]|nr:YdeI/OmpD-associated family protein [Candidatus Gracilibacteria bacterium]